MRKDPGNEDETGHSTSRVANSVSFKLRQKVK